MNNLQQSAVNLDGKMVYVSGGEMPRAFGLGKMKVKPFMICKYAVTMEEWQHVLRWALEQGYEISPGAAAGPNYPVTDVNWSDAVKWCNAKSVMEGLTPVYGIEGERGHWRTGEIDENSNIATRRYPDANGYRLPSELEWEWAARGGIYSKFYQYAGSDTIDYVAWFNENSGGGAHEVGQKEPNELGLFDMSGNTWEWCNDIVNLTNRRVRGGGWFCPAKYSALNERDTSFIPSLRGVNIGFRIACITPNSNSI